MEGKKFDNNKLRWDLLDFEILEEVVKVLTYGAQKYDDNNWQKVDNAYNRYFSALMRHITAWRKGEDLDKETNCHHLASAICNLMFLIWFEKQKMGSKSETPIMRYGEVDYSCSKL